MLRVTVHEQNFCWRMQLEGKLAGASVKEAADTWSAPRPEEAPVEIDLTGVTAVDSEGLELLRVMKAAGARLRTQGVKMKALIGGLADAPADDEPCGWAKHLSGSSG